MSYLLPIYYLNKIKVHLIQNKEEKKTKKKQLGNTVAIFRLGCNHWLVWSWQSPKSRLPSRHMISKRCRTDVDATMTLNRRKYDVIWRHVPTESFLSNFIAITLQAYDAVMTSYPRRCDVMITHKPRCDVISTLCACWVQPLLRNKTIYFCDK